MGEEGSGKYAQGRVHTKMITYGVETLGDGICVRPRGIHKPRGVTPGEKNQVEFTQPTSSRPMTPCFIG